MAVRTERKSLDIAITKMPRKQGGGWQFEFGTIHTAHYATFRCPFPFNPLYSFLDQPQGYPYPMPLFYQPLQTYPQTSGIQQGFQLANSENNFVQNTNFYNTTVWRPKSGFGEF